LTVLASIYPSAQEDTLKLRLGVAPIKGQPRIAPSDKRFVRNPDIFGVPRREKTSHVVHSRVDWPRARYTIETALRNS
jgi:hypothetical protein